MNRAIETPKPAKWLWLTGIFPNRYLCQVSNCKHNALRGKDADIINCDRDWIAVDREGECSQFVEKGSEDD